MVPMEGVTECGAAKSLRHPTLVICAENAEADI